MMTYTPKPGDRVTSPLLVGEWEVQQVIDDGWCDLMNDDGRRVSVKHQASLTPVAPPLPPEPPVGSVVRAHGRMWMRGREYPARLPERAWWEHPESIAREWSDLATAPDLSPVVAVDDVADWLDGSWASKALGDEFRAEFDGWS